MGVTSLCDATHDIVFVGPSVLPSGSDRPFWVNTQMWNIAEGIVSGLENVPGWINSPTLKIYISDDNLPDSFIEIVSNYVSNNQKYKYSEIHINRIATLSDFEIELNAYSTNSFKIRNLAICAHGSFQGIRMTLDSGAAGRISTTSSWEFKEFRFRNVKEVRPTVLDAWKNFNTDIFCDAGLAYLTSCQVGVASRRYNVDDNNKFTSWRDFSREGIHRVNESVAAQFASHFGVRTFGYLVDTFSWLYLGSWDIIKEVFVDNVNSNATFQDESGKHYIVYHADMPIPNGIPNTPTYATPYTLEAFSEEQIAELEISINPNNFPYFHLCTDGSIAKIWGVPRGHSSDEFGRLDRNRRDWV